MPPYRAVAAVAETNLLLPLQRAAESLRRSGVEMDLVGFASSDIRPDSALWDEIARADALFVSMINTDNEARLLAGRLRCTRPPATLVFNSQPELMTFSRLGYFDALALTREERLKETARALQKKGVPLPPMAHVILAAAGKVYDKLDDRDPLLKQLKLYASAARYWNNASGENLERLLRFLLWLNESETKDGTSPTPAAPIIYPPCALWHPGMPQPVTELEAYRDWYFHTFDLRPDRWVGAILFRQFVLSGNTEHYASLFTELRRQGLGVVGGFSTLDNTPLIETYFERAGIDALINLTGFNLVGSMGRPDPTTAVTLLSRLDLPYLVAAPLLFQTLDEWRRDPRGVTPAQVAIQIATPEMEGATEPRIFGGLGNDMAYHPDEDQVDRLARRVRRWVDLRRKEVRNRRIAVCIFSFPPDKGTVGSAAYLDVFASLYNLLVSLKEEGYTVRLPANPTELREELTGTKGETRRLASPIADRLTTDEYRRIAPEHERIEKAWGPAPGSIDVDRGHLLVRGAEFGNVFIGIQPGFGYEGDPMRLLLMPDAAPSHSFAAFYAWIKHVFRADAVVHFGTHGALEFMPGKQVGLTAACFPDALVDDLPHGYFYSVNNPSEATIAKRRSGAAIVSYLSPPLSQAGLYKDLLSLKESLTAWWERSGGERSRDETWSTIRTLAQKCSLDQELPPPKKKTQQPSSAPAPNQEPSCTEDLGTEQELDAYVDRLTAYLRHLEQRLIPIGLHVAGRPLDSQSLASYLWAEARTGRPEKGIPPLIDWLGERLGSATVERNGLPQDSRQLPVGEAESEEVAAAAKKVVLGFVSAGEEGARRSLKSLGVDVTTSDHEPTWKSWIAHMSAHRRLLQCDGELRGISRALAGKYLAPSPGGDPVRTPEILPTGRNMHAVDPYRIPSRVARAVARRSVEKLLDLELERSGDYPQSVAVVLWGTDNIKNQGEGVAQVLELLGVEPVEDSLGRLTRLKLIPLGELGRPRIDVVMTVSGIFRDIFGITAALLQKAVDLAASADEPAHMNHVRRRTLELSQQLEIDRARAARRVFTNNPGAYGTGVNHVVESSEWEMREDLAAVFLGRKSFAMTGEGLVREEDLFAGVLGGVQLTWQNVDSSEIGLADVDHYYEYLGGLGSAVESTRGEPVRSYISDTLGEEVAVRTVQEEVSLEARSKLLNPKWYEALLKHGYQGVHEIANRVENTFGWSATSDAVGAWVYRQVSETYAEDRSMRARLTQLNPQAFQRMVGRLLEADARGFWEATPAQREDLASLYDSLEATQEGVTG